MWTLKDIDGARVWTRAEGDSTENVIQGHMTEGVALYLQAWLDLVLESHQPIFLYQDWEAAPTYDSACRISWQGWLARQTQLGGIKFLTTSKLVRMAVVVANIAYPHGTFRVYSQRPEYEKDRDARLPRIAHPLTASSSASQ